MQDNSRYNVGSWQRDPTTLAVPVITHLSHQQGGVLSEHVGGPITITRHKLCLDSRYSNEIATVDRVDPQQWCSAYRSRTIVMLRQVHQPFRNPTELHDLPSDYTHVPIQRLNTVSYRGKAVEHLVEMPGVETAGNSVTDAVVQQAGSFEKGCQLVPVRSPRRTHAAGDGSGLIAVSAATRHAHRHALTLHAIISVDVAVVPWAKESRKGVTNYA